MDSFADKLRGTNLVLFEDSRATQSGLLNGHISRDLNASLAVHFWTRCADLDVFPWLERVASESNPADNPSRREHGFNCPTQWKCMRLPAVFHEAYKVATPPDLIRGSTNSGSG